MDEKSETRIPVGESTALARAYLDGSGRLDLAIEQGLKLVQHIHISKDKVELYVLPSTYIVMHCMDGTKTEADPSEWLSAMREKKLRDEISILKDRIKFLESKLDIPAMLASAAAQMAEASKPTLFEGLDTETVPH